MIIFNKEDHSYREGEIKYKSVSSFVHFFTNPFEEDFWLRYKALEVIIHGLVPDENGFYPKVSGHYRQVMKYGINEMEFLYIDTSVKRDRYEKVQQQLKNAWDAKNKKSTDKGTLIHDEKEQEYLDTGVYQGLPVFGRKEGYDNVSRDFEEDGCYLELVVHSKKYRIAGQSDKVIKRGVKVVVRDYKTNEELKKTAFNNATMKYPFDSLPDSNFYHYCVQLSTYAWLLEQEGYEVEALYIEHWDGEEWKEEKVPYVGFLIEEGLKIFTK